MNNEKKYSSDSSAACRSNLCTCVRLVEFSNGAQGMTSDGGNMSIGTNMANMTMGRNATGVGNVSNTSTAMSDGAMMAISS